MSNNLHEMVKQAVSQFLIEADEPDNPGTKEPVEKKVDKPKAKPKPDEKKKKKDSGSSIKVLGSYGPGDWSDKIKKARTRAQEEPGLLMKDLGVGNATGDTDSEKAASIISQAIKNNKEISAAFLGPVLKKGATVDGKLISLMYEVNVKGQILTPRNTAAYIWMILHAAERTGRLQMDNGIAFIPFESGVPAPKFYDLPSE